MTNTTVTSVADAVQALSSLLRAKGSAVDRTENLSARQRFGNVRVFTVAGEVYHLKYSKKLFQPRENVVGGAADLDRKLKFAVQAFGNGDNTLNGVDEDLLVELLQQEEEGRPTYFVTVMSDGRVLWRTGREAYEFVLRYDTIMHFPRAFAQPVCFVPTGWLVNRSNVATAVPMVVP